MKTVLKIAFLFLFLVSCNNGENKSYGFLSTSSDSAKTIGYAEMSDKKEYSKEETQNSSEEIERKLIKRGDISFETDDLSVTKKHIEENVKKFNGYISEDNQYKSSDNVTYNLTVRIPSKDFDTFLAEISSKVDNFDSKNISVNDVTEQFLDVQARLKVKKALEQRYSELLKKTKSVKEILEVERELNTVRADIESMEGRLKYLQNQVSFSTLNIRFYKVEISKSSSKSFGRKLINSFSNGIDNIKWFFLGLVNIWPFIILIVLVYIFIKRRFKKK